MDFQLHVHDVASIQIQIEEKKLQEIEGSQRLIKQSFQVNSYI